VARARYRGALGDVAGAPPLAATDRDELGARRSTARGAMQDSPTRAAMMAKMITRLAINARSMTGSRSPAVGARAGSMSQRSPAVCGRVKSESRPVDEVLLAGSGAALRSLSGPLQALRAARSRRPFRVASDSEHSAGDRRAHGDDCGRQGSMCNSRHVQLQGQPFVERLQRQCHQTAWRCLSPFRSAQIHTAADVINLAWSCGRSQVRSGPACDRGSCDQNPKPAPLPSCCP
jgi:hypothetical protein